ncbi:MAG: cbb3-type cytochrome c oxidase subunit 3 [Ignavibacteriales bacterium]|nr:cbb3-type cytochrome c oxidase subunit 3 [Ignavibacteriota bacterium]MCB9249762.1 cbb3-type cytochrome c oxidase subunit 3 [Ignavibacteriales bacterium]
MKFSHYLSSIENVGIFPMISLILFLSVFIGAIIWIVTRDKEYISELEKIPLDNDNFSNNIENKNESD